MNAYSKIAGVLGLIAVSIQITGCDRNKLESDKAQQSYSVGFALGQQLNKVQDDIDPDIVASGLKDGIRSTNGENPAPRLSADVMQRRMQELQVKRNQREALSAAETLKASQEYIAATAKNAGVRLLEEGILIEEGKLTDGRAAKKVERALKENDEITVRYVAKRTDGTIVDQTPNAGGTKIRFREIPLPGLRKALAKMPVGAEWKIHLSPEQAYGASTRPGVPSQSALIYEIQLLSVETKK